MPPIHENTKCCSDYIASFLESDRLTGCPIYIIFSVSLGLFYGIYIEQDPLNDAAHYAPPQGKLNHSRSYKLLFLFVYMASYHNKLLSCIQLVSKTLL